MSYRIPLLLLLGVACLASPTVRAQFSSGSTGADGALSVATDQSLVLPPSGILNYTTINISTGTTLTILANASNTPAILLASGNVVITGAINIAGANGLDYSDPAAGTPGSGARPGPGGFPGGIGAIAVINGGTGIASSGGGPGGGLASTD